MIAGSVFVNHLCEAKRRQDGGADKSEESFCELVSPDRVSRQRFSEAYPSYQRILNAGIEIHFLSIRDVLKPNHSFTDNLRVGVEIDRKRRIRFEERAGRRGLD
jgi:hypothetical protein